MKVHQLLTNTIVRLPDDILQEYQHCCGGSREMYIIGPMGGDFFLSPDAPEVPKRVLFPMPKSVNPADILTWDMVSFKNP